MHLLFCLNSILTNFRPLFNQQNFQLFCAFIIGFTVHPGRKTVTGLYQGSRPESRYWSMIKFLSRGKWCADEVAQHLIRLLQTYFANWVYVYDESHAIKSGKQQWGLHFFRNHGYRKGKTNQSKYHFGHQFGALGLLCLNQAQAILFPVWVKLMCPDKKRDNSFAVVKQILSKIPKGLIIFDRGFNRRKLFELLLSLEHHLLCRAKSNAVFYRLPKALKNRQRGRPKRYGKRLRYRFCGRF